MSRYAPLQLAEAFIQAGELADALEALRAHLDAQPEDDAARRLLIAVSQRAENAATWHEALAASRELAAPTAADLHTRSVLWEQLGDLPRAIEAQQTALAQHPDDERAGERLVTLHIAAADYAAALELVRAQPRTWRWLQWEGDILACQGDDLLATARYGLALAQLEHLPPHPYFENMKARMLLARAHAYRRAGLLEPAHAHYTAAARHIPDDPMIPFCRGLIAAASGDLSNAVTLCREALASAAPAVQAEMQRELQHTPELARQL